MTQQVRRYPAYDACDDCGVLKESCPLIDWNRLEENLAEGDPEAKLELSEALEYHQNLSLRPFQQSWVGRGVSHKLKVHSDWWIVDADHYRAYILHSLAHTYFFVT